MDSVTLNEAVGIALVEADLAKVGTQLEIFENEYGDDRIYGEVVKMPFYDPEVGYVNDPALSTNNIMIAAEVSKTRLAICRQFI